MPRMGSLAKGRQKFSNFHCAIPEGAVKTKVSTLRTHTTASSSCPTNQGGPICHHGKGLRKKQKTDAPDPTRQKPSTTKQKGFAMLHIASCKPSDKVGQGKFRMGKVGRPSQNYRRGRDFTRKYLVTNLVPACGTTRKTCKSKE